MSPCLPALQTILPKAAYNRLQVRPLFNFLQSVRYCFCDEAENAEEGTVARSIPAPTVRTHGIALDGYPATLVQAEDLAKMVPDLKLKPIAFQIQVPDEVIRERAKKSGKQSDRPQILEQRQDHAVGEIRRHGELLDVRFLLAALIRVADRDAARRAVDRHVERPRKRRDFLHEMIAEQSERATLRKHGRFIVQ
jgi:adenylate kinase family enzyme